MERQLRVARDFGNLLASADEHGLLVVAGWTINIPVNAAIEYAKKFDSSPDFGFFKHEGKVVLSHGPVKLTLTDEEASAVVELTKEAYGPF